MRGNKNAAGRRNVGVVSYGGNAPEGYKKPSARLTSAAAFIGGAVESASMQSKRAYQGAKAGYKLGAGARKLANAFSSKSPVQKSLLSVKDGIGTAISGAKIGRKVGAAEARVSKAGERAGVSALNRASSAAELGKTWANNTAKKIREGVDEVRRRRASKSDPFASKGRST